MSKIISGVLLPTDEDAEPIPVPISDLKSIQDLVGGLIDAVVTDYTTDDFPNAKFDEQASVRVVGYVHDEGLLLGLPFNKLATLMFGRALHGPVVVVGDGGNGDNADLPSWFLSLVFGGDLRETVRELSEGAETMRDAVMMAVADGFISPQERDEILMALISDDQELVAKAVGCLENILMYSTGVQLGVLSRYNEIPEDLKSLAEVKIDLSDDAIQKWLEEQ